MHANENQIWLARLSKEIGSRIPIWNQGAGGNISVKVGSEIWIKASGTRLYEMTQTTGWVAVDGTKVRLESEDAYAKSLRESVRSPAPRPSMETALHLALKNNWVMHFHSLPAIVMGHHHKTEPERLQKWLAGKIDFAIAPPVAPGLGLALEVGKRSDATAIILQNHGVLLQAKDSTSAIALVRRWENLEFEFCRAFGYLAPDRWHAREPLTLPDPLRHYFPDAAVFAGELAGVTDPKTRGIRRDAWSGSRDVCEIAWATAVLFATCPALEAFPTDIASSLSSLPTEIHRKLVSVRGQ